MNIRFLILPRLLRRILRPPLWGCTIVFILALASEQDASGPYDIDLKGSPDGTKIAFVCTYDLKDGPVARIQEVTRDAIRVDSTAGFPEKGGLINASLPPKWISADGRSMWLVFSGRPSDPMYSFNLVRMNLDVPD